MEPREQEIAIGELEERVDRLRVLYEQYFLGFEKLEPTVPRKDVDRRFAILRKEQIRNTAVRFRFQVVTQKFNTYAMHWMRICRQIEDGTYKRHLRKAQQRFGEGSPDMVARRAKRDAIELEFSEVDLDEAMLEVTAADAPKEATPAPIVATADERKASGPAGEPKLRAYRDLGAAPADAAPGGKVQRPQVVLRSTKDGEGKGDPLLRTGERAAVQPGTAAERIEPSKPDLLARTGERPNAPRPPEPSKPDLLARTGERPNAAAADALARTGERPADPLARTGARPVALPPGAKPRIVLKRPDGVRPEGAAPENAGARPPETAAARPSPAAPPNASKPGPAPTAPKPSPPSETAAPRPPAAPVAPKPPAPTGATPPAGPKPPVPGIGVRPQGPKPPPPLPSKKS